MNNKHYVGRRAKSITLGRKLPPVSGVVLSGDNDTVFVAGNERGYVVETFVPNATQQMANDLLNKMRGFEYQGYTAQNAFIPPDVELGDGITVKGVYGVLASREYSFTPKMTENISAPYENEDEHEYGYKGNYAQELAHKVQQGQLYYGTRISKKNGLEIVKTDGNIEKSRVILNSDTLAFYNNNGQEAFYYDAPSGVFRITQYANVEDALNGSQAFAKLELTAQQLQVQINDAKGNISTLTQTATSLQSQISSNDRDISTLTQTATSLQSQITNAVGDISSIEQYAKSIRLSVSNGYQNSTISLTANGVAIDSETITFTGAVTYQALSGQGTTVINGSNITTGTISAARINLTGAISWSELSSSVENYIDAAYDNADSAIDIANSAADDIVNLANGYFRNGTFIDRTSIYSPEIYAQEMSIIAESNSGGLYLYGPYNSRNYCMFAVEYYGGGDAPNIDIYSPAGGTITLHATYIGKNASALLEIQGYTMFFGTVNFTNANVIGLT